MLKRLAPALALLLFGACLHPRPVKPLAQTVSGPSLGVRVKLFAPIPIFMIPPRTVYFALIDPDFGNLQGPVIASNYSSGDRYYALDVEPGTYVAVAAHYTNGQSEGYTTYFSSAIVVKSLTAVGPSGLAYLGDYSVYMKPGLRGADAVQAHYAKVLHRKPGAPIVLRLLSGNFSINYRGAALTASNDAKSRDTFLEKAERDLSRRDEITPSPVVARKFYWSGAEGNMGLEIAGKFFSEANLRRALAGEREVGRFGGRPWILREILVSTDLNADDSAAVWTVSGPKPLIAAYAQSLRRGERDRTLFQTLGFTTVKFKPAD